jgi:hypothetical protein
MRDMMAQIRDVGDGIRGGTYTMTAPVITGGSITGVALSGNTLTNPVITGGSINNTPIGASTANTGAFTTLSASSTATLNTLVSSGATLTGGSINGMAIGGSTAAAGNFTTLGATGVATFSAGTVSAPAITTTGDTNTGIFFPAADTIAFTEGGAESMRLDSSGNLLVGTTGSSFTANVTIEANHATDSAFVLKTGGTVRGYLYATGSEFRIDSRSTSPLTFFTNGAESMRITSSGNVGIGTSSPNTKLHTDLFGATGVTAPTAGNFVSYAGGSNAASAGFGVALTNDNGNKTGYFGADRTGGDAFNGITVAATSNHPMRFLTNNTERMRITSDGLVGIGTSSPGEKLSIAGSANVFASLTSTGGVKTQLFAADAVGGGMVGTVSNHPFRIDTNNTERMRIDSSGNVGIGTSSPGQKLEVFNAGGGPIFRVTSTVTGVGTGNGFSIGLDGDGAAYLTQNENQPLLLLTNNTERMRIDSSGNVGIGTSSPSFKLDVAGNGRIGNVYDTGLTIAQAGNSITYPTDNTLAFNTNTTERMRITSSGNVLVGKTAIGSDTLGVGFATGDGTNQWRCSIGNAGSTSAAFGLSIYSTGASAYRMYVDMAGTIFATSIVISAISDERLKENIKDIDTGLDSIMALKPRRFDWKDGKGQDKKNVAGFIAQEFEAVFPECVGTTKAGADGIEYKNINHETLIPTLVKAIQEQQTLINNLTTRLNALEGK